MSNPFLVGKKTILRPITLADAPLLNQWINDPDTRKYLLTSFPVSEIAEKDWIEKQSKLGPNQNAVTLAVETQEGKLIGTMGLHDINWISRNAITGTLIGDKEHRSKGFATDAKIALLRYAFETLGLHKVISHAFSANAASIAYSKRCGYIVEAILKDQIFRDGKWQDMTTLACFYPAWKKAAKKYTQS